jgi:predicted NUDIX family NTP pyrophosphohydrolase
VPKRSAGLLVYRPVTDGIEVLAVHPGGPFWAKKDNGAWSIPKGELESSDEPYATARREFEEEIGSPPPEGDPMDLGEIRQAGGKIVRAFALRSPDSDDQDSDDQDSDDQDSDGQDFAHRRATVPVKSNLVELEWPRGTGRILTFPEVDKAEWMSPEIAREKLVPAQVEFVDRLLERLGA